MGISFMGVAVLAVVLAFQPPLEVPAGAALVAMAFFLGLGAGGVFPWVALGAPKEQVGTVSGLVGAAGGLGGYFPPLVLGATFGAVFAGYGFGLILLAVVAVGAMAFTFLAIPRTAREMESVH